MRALVRKAAPLVVAPLVIAATAASAAPPTVENLDEARVLQTWQVPSQAFGWAVADVGDLDGDRARDVLVAAPSYDAAGSANDGRVYVQSSRGGRLRVLSGRGPAEAFGFSLASAGDVTGDGVDDYVVGAPGYLSLVACPTSLADPGHVYLYSGATGRVVHRFTGTQPGEMFGYAVAGAGDVDGDGVPDLVAGAACADTGAGADAGRVDVLSGGTFRRIDRIHGATAAAQLGSAVAAVGDVDADGVSDLVAGAKDGRPQQRGRATVFSGATRDVLWSFAGGRRTADLGWFFVAGVPDVDADGVRDVYAADFDTGDPAAPDGRVYVLSGRTGRPVHIVNGGPGAGAGPGRYLGGDADGDGVDDLVVGSYTSSVGSSFGGQVDVVSGRTGKLLRSLVSRVPGALLGYDAVGLGDVDGDDKPDFLVSAAPVGTVYLVAGA